MKADDRRRGLVQLTVLLAMLVPGGALFFWGLHSCQAARHFGIPGAIAVVAGLGLTMAGGFYHYRTDYRKKSRQDAGATGRVAFLVITIASTAAAVLAHRLLLR